MKTWQVHPESIDPEAAFQMEAAEAIQHALDIAAQTLKVPTLLDAHATATRPEERSVIIQVAEFFQKISKVRVREKGSRVLGSRVLGVATNQKSQVVPNVDIRWQKRGPH